MLVKLRPDVTTVNQGKPSKPYEIAGTPSYLLSAKPDGLSLAAA